jgi:hypothetical protein
VHLDLGLQGLAILGGVSLGFGIVAQLVFWNSATRWLWLIGGTAWFVGGLFASEVVWGTLTEEEIQPIVDGLAFDESLLGGLVLGLPVVLLTWYVGRRRRSHPPMSS